jgi:hypothetical protein
MVSHRPAAPCLTYSGHAARAKRRRSMKEKKRWALKLAPRSKAEVSRVEPDWKEVIRKILLEKYSHAGWSQNHR